MRLCELRISGWGQRKFAGPSVGRELSCGVRERVWPHRCGDSCGAGGRAAAHEIDLSGRLHPSQPRSDRSDRWNDSTALRPMARGGGSRAGTRIIELNSPRGTLGTK